jgi:hypothetical protein
MTNNTNDQTFNDVEAEAFAEHEARKAVEKAKIEEEETVKRDAYRKTEQENRRNANVRRSEHLLRISAIVNATADATGKCHVAFVDAENFKLVIDGVDTSYRVDYSESWSKGYGSFGRDSKVTGMKMTIGDYGNRTTHRQKKDGTFNYHAIAEKLIDYANLQNAKARMEKQRVRNANKLPQLIAEIFPNSEKAKYQDVLAPSSASDRPVFFKFKIEQSMTIDEARKLAVAIRGCGIKLHYSDEVKS